MLSVIEKSSYCHLHILNSRFATSLGYRRCAYRWKGKRCHRPVKVSASDLPENFRDSDLPEANEAVVCGRHSGGDVRTGDQSSSRSRIEKSYFDIPDSEGDSDSFEHPLENANREVSYFRETAKA